MTKLIGACLFNGLNTVVELTFLSLLYIKSRHTGIDNACVGVSSGTNIVPRIRWLYIWDAENSFLLR